MMIVNTIKDRWIIQGETSKITKCLQFPMFEEAKSSLMSLVDNTHMEVGWIDSLNPLSFTALH